MRILICARCLTEGGAERVASLWAKGFCQNGHQVEIILLDGSLPITYDVPREVNINKLFLSNGKRFNSVRIVKSIRLIIKESKPDVIITVLHPSGYLTRIASIGLKIPVIFTDHNTYEWSADAQRNTRLEKFFKFHFNKLFSCVTVLTDVDRMIISKSLKRVYTLPNPLTFEIASSIPPKENIVLAAGRLDRWRVKGFDTLIEGWALIAKRYPKWKLIIAGQGTKSSENHLKNLAIQNKVDDQVDFCGFIQDILPYYRKSSIFVLSSRYEGFGMVLIEAMSQGCAAISCDFNGRQKEIINCKDFGIIIPSGSPQLLGEAINSIIMDEKYRRILQENAMKRSAKYQLPEIMNKWNSILKEVL